MGTRGCLRAYPTAHCRKQAGGNAHIDALCPVEGLGLGTAGRILANPFGMDFSLLRIFTLAVLSSSPQALAAHALAQQACDYSTAGSSQVVAFPLASQTKNLLVAFVEYGGPPRSVSVSDSLGNTYHPISQESSSIETVEVWYAWNEGSGPNRVTAVAAGATSGLGVFLHEYSGFEAGVLVKHSTAHGSSASPDSGSLLVGDGEVLAAHCQAQATLLGPSPGFAVRGTCIGDLSEDLIDPLAGSYSAQFQVATPTQWVASLVAFADPAPSGTSALNSGASSPPPVRPASGDYEVGCAATPGPLFLLLTLWRNRRPRSGSLRSRSGRPHGNAS
jgi:hypothetical protein